MPGDQCTNVQTDAEYGYMHGICIKERCTERNVSRKMTGKNYFRRI